MKNVKRITESQLRAIVAESVKKVLNEAYKVGEFDYPKEFNMDYAPIRLSNDDFNMAFKAYFHSQAICGALMMFAVRNPNV